jgi:hypothetical protein
MVVNPHYQVRSPRVSGKHRLVLVLELLVLELVLVVLILVLLVLMVI